MALKVPFNHLCHSREAYSAMDDNKHYYFCCAWVSCFVFGLHKADVGTMNEAVRSGIVFG